MRTATLVAAFVVWGLSGCAAQVPAVADPALTLEDLHARYVPRFLDEVAFEQGEGGKAPVYDSPGYGGYVGWAASYAMVTLNLLYEATGDTACLDKSLEFIETMFSLRDSDLATTYGADPYMDTQRGRVLKAWGTGYYTGGKHTCWAVHTGMAVYPAAEFVRLVRDGGAATAAWYERVNEYVPEMEAAVREFDAEWRDGPEDGMGYYVFPNGSILPNNQMNAPGRALFALHDITGEDEYARKAHALARFLKSKLTHVIEGDHYLWGYSQGSPDGPPGSGEDVSHASINAHFMYVAWEHGVAFDDTDMQRLTRTFTEGIYLGGGQCAGSLDSGSPDTTYTPQLARWMHLARFDPDVEKYMLEFVAANSQGADDADGFLSPNLGSMAYGFLARARALRGDDPANG